MHIYLVVYNIREYYANSSQQLLYIHGFTFFCRHIRWSMRPLAIAWSSLITTRRSTWTNVIAPSLRSGSGVNITRHTGNSGTGTNHYPAPTH